MNNHFGQLQIRRRNRGRRRNLLIFFLKFLFLFLLLESIYVAYNSPYLRVDKEKTKIIGARVLSEAELLERIKIPVRTNLFRVDLPAIRRILKKHPRIKEVVATRNFPNSITINIIERRTFAQLKIGDYFLIVDPGGVVFDKSLEVLRSVPIIEGIGISPLTLAKSSKGSRLSLALNCLELMQRHKLPKVLRVQINKDNRLYVILNDGLKILYGRPERLADKIRFCQAILESKNINGKNAQYLDLRSLEAPVWKAKDFVD